jgi:hypothetical protein
LDAEIDALSKSLVVELAGSIGFRDSRLVQKIIGPIFRPVTDRLARVGATFSRNMAEYGFSRAMGMALNGFVRKVTARGGDSFPSAGPLLVVSNHPGTYDSLVIASQLRRDDLRIISSDIPFVMRLQHAKDNFIFISRNEFNRMAAARQAIRHLKRNGAVMLYGFGQLDSDPAVYDDAPTQIEQWMASINLFLKTVPETRLVLSIVSHVVSPKWRHSLLYWLRQKPLDRRRLVEFGQVIYQLLFPGRLLLSPFISFSTPITVPELHRASGSGDIRAAIISRAKALLADHMAWVATST